MIFASVNFLPSARENLSFGEHRVVCSKCSPLGKSSATYVLRYILRPFVTSPNFTNTFASPWVRVICIQLTSCFLVILTPTPGAPTVYHSQTISKSTPQTYNFPQ